MKKIFLYINLIVLTVIDCQAQEYSLLKTIQVEANFIEVDPFGNFYIVEDFKITKYNENGKFLYVFNEIENGAITSLDVSRPLKLVVFYKDFSVLQLLDQRLAILNTINLLDRNLDFVQVVANANGDNYWVYDNLSNSVKKLNKSLNVEYESESFFNLFTEGLAPIKLIENEESIFLLDNNGIFMFDNFANYQKTIPIKNMYDFQLVNGKIVYLDKLNFVSYHLKTLQVEILDIPKMESLQSAKVFKTGLLLLTKNQLHIYQLK